MVRRATHMHIHSDTNTHILTYLECKGHLKNHVVDNKQSCAFGVDIYRRTYRQWEMWQPFVNNGDWPQTTAYNHWNVIRVITHTERVGKAYLSLTNARHTSLPNDNVCSLTTASDWSCSTKCWCVSSQVRSVYLLICFTVCLEKVQLPLWTFKC